MVGVAQLVRAAGCGPAGRGFKSRHSPHFFAESPEGDVPCRIYFCPESETSRLKK